MADDPATGNLRCNRCGLDFAYDVPLRIVGQLRKGQRSSPPNGTTWCFNCGAKWEVGPLLEVDHDRGQGERAA